MLDILLGQAQSVRRGQVGGIDVEQGLHRCQGAVVHQALGNIVVDLQGSTQQQVTSDSTAAHVPTLGDGQVPGSGRGGGGQLSMGGRWPGSSGAQLAQGCSWCREADRLEGSDGQLSQGGS